MRRILLAAFCLFPIASVAQIRPAENDTLNYRLVGFSLPEMPATDSYRVEIARGRINNSYDFAKNIILAHKDTSNRFIIELPAFGQDYTWRITDSRKKSRKEKPSLYHFRVGSSIFLDTARHRVRVIDTARTHDNLLVFLDNSRTLIDLAGNAYWYLPELPGIVDSSSSIRDLKLTPFGTITFLNGRKAYEIDLDGKVLWRPPDDGQVSGDTSEFYHHEFTRLANGRYMILGNENISRKIPNVRDTALYNNEWNVVKRNGEYFKLIECGTIIEYDTTGRAVWSWKSSGYLSDADFFSNLTPQGTPNVATHLNSFYFDGGSHIYASFRNLNRVIKIEYPSRRVVKEYGQTFSTGSTDRPSPFYGQHSCRIDSNGRLYLYNNNTLLAGRTKRNDNAISTIMVFKNSPDSSDHKVVWEFPCDIDTFAKASNPSGGGVEQLEDGSFLVCMGVSHRCFIVDPAKKIRWNALTEKKLPGEEWVPFESYRASPAERTTIYGLIMKQLQPIK
ncbi:MAG: hypothetical protein K0R82_1240 [Flavipsychrobacter sp.]|jgi:hypothetical protein|nr:hypothetical protein [Flavipsychrobacter sp.]